MSGKPKTAPSPARKFPHLIIRASAGAGKTFQLSNRFIGLLNEDEVSADSILATTFTRKAAGEILDRVLLRLAKAALDDKEAKDLAQHVGQASLTRARCLELISRTARLLHRLRIGTLDSFFAQLARGFGLELGLPPGWQIVDDAEDAHLRREAVAAVLRQEDTPALRTLVNHLTKGETKRGVAELVHTTVADLYGLFLDAPPSAWRSLPRHSSLSQEELHSELKALQEAPLEKSRMQTARDKDVEIAAAEDWGAFIKSGLAAKVRDGALTYYKDEIPTPVVRLYQRLLKQAQADLVGRVVLQTESTCELLEKFHREYERLKHERRVLRFEDITRRLANVSLMGDVDRLAFRLDAHLEHLLLDEFQDTSPAQWRVIRPFARRITDGHPRRSFFCVGDVKQAIYGWRGGVAEIFDSVEQELEGLASQPLNKSFRSAQPVIDVVNQVFSRLASHPNLNRETEGVRLWAERFAPHTTQHTNLPGYVCLEASAVNEDESETSKTARLRYAAERIAQIEKASPGRQMGVLLRSNEGVARLVFELRNLGVAASEEGGNALTDSAAVQAILSLLKLADHPGDGVARFHVEQTPLASLFAAEGPAGQPEGKARLNGPKVSLAVRRELIDSGYGPAIRRWAETLVPLCDRRELARLVQLIELAYGYDARATLRTADFLEFVNLQRVPDPTGANVRVMTIHQAKGLEFEIVVLPELDGSLIGQPKPFVVHRPDPAGPIERICRYASEAARDLLPTDVQVMFEAAATQEVTESLCVLYVALTRAERALYMLVAPSKEGEKSLPKTLAGVLRAALCGVEPIAAKTIHYEHGDPLWFQKDAPPKKPARRKAGAERPAEPAPDSLEVRLAPPGEQPARGFERVAPSGLEGGPKVRLSGVFRPRENQPAMDRGTLIHAFFEQVDWLDEGPPPRDTLLAAAQQALEPSVCAALGVENIIEAFHAMLAKPAVAQALSRAAYANLPELGFPPEVQREFSGAGPRLEVRNEYSFALRLEGHKLMQGSIDRLVLLYAGKKLIAAEILDYKTDSISPDTPEALREKVEHYRPQLAAYRRAVAQLFRLPENRVTARLLFVGAGVMAPVPTT